MKTEPSNSADSDQAPRKKAGGPQLLRRVLKLSVVVVLPLIVIAAILPRKVSAKKLSGSDDREKPATRESLVVRETQLQDVVGRLKTRMSIPDAVVVSIVEHNELVVSVERAKDGAGGFSLSIERYFLDGVTTDEIDAVIAHELGHVWIFSHHPYLQTEELANQIATQVVSKDTLATVYDKVWTRVGRKGGLVYLPAAGASANAHQSQ